MARRPKPVKQPVEGASYLTMEDVYRLELLHAQMDIAARNKQILEREDALARAGVKIAQLEARITELLAALSGAKREKAISEEDATISRKTQERQALRGELGERYGIEDWDKVGYNPETGQLNYIP